MSRRLGRPAKKRDVTQEDHPDQAQLDHPRHQANRRIRSPRKKRVKRERAHRSSHDIAISQDDEELVLDEITFHDSMVDDMSAEDTRLPTPPFLDTDKPSLYEGSDNLDLSDSWLQEFMSNQPADLTQDRNFLDALGLHNTTDNGLGALSADSKDLSTSFKGVGMSTSELQEQIPLVAYYPTGNNFSAHSEPTIETVQGMSDVASPYAEILKRDPLAWPQTVSSSMENDSLRLPVTSEQLNPLVSKQGQRRTQEYGPSSDDPRAITNFSPCQYQCQCHEHTARELMRVNISASRTWPSVTIDSILNCQRILQQLADTILQCAICCKTRVNLLMVVVVSIDSLVTTLETITSIDSSAVDSLFAEYHDHRMREFGHEVPAGVGNRRYRSASLQFKAQVEACPLLVGGFPVPSEEKFTFVKQVLHTRLCGLSNIISRIQLCTQELLAVSASWGRLTMMMETDRRLQLVMTKMKAPARH
ncbi:hypothetical protein BBP40_003942 [Aspergillus hancockii]|nr:hypothetical protein BBP40_003942 [Aspergillus hancockii]